MGSTAAINLKVSDGNDSDNGGNDSVEGNVYVPAVADAGGPHAINEGSSVTLSGSASTGVGGGPGPA